MAIYHLSGTLISRSQGRSVVACAAYRAGACLDDARQAKTHDYSRKHDVAHTEILLPEGAPLWMGDRQTLWNTVETIEKRKDAQLAREFHFALPRELTLEQNIALAKEFVQAAFVDQGMVADVSIHNDRLDNGEYQPHAHVMLTLREVTSKGFGHKVREWNARENLLQWREQWAETANRHLALQGHDLRIDHRTLKEQGIDLEPQHKIGAAVVQDKLARLVDHQRIARENGEKIFANPSIALDAITRQQSTFTHHDLARFINRHTENAEQFQRVYAAVKASPELVMLGVDGHQRERLTTRDMLAVETRLLNLAQQLPQREGHAVSEAAKTMALSTRQLTDEQRVAFDHLLKSEDLRCVVGYAGTGKSYLLGAAREAWEGQGYRVLGATLSGIAAENLQASSGIESRTLASRCYYWDRGEERLTANDVLVIDEAGMLGSRQMARVLEEVEKHGAKVVLLGDPEQLQAIEAGAAFRAISEHVGMVELTEIRRQHADWQKAATVELATGQTELALARYQEHNHMHVLATQAEAKDALITLWNDVRLSQPEKTHILLAYTRADVRELNDKARALRQCQHELGEGQLIMTHRGEREFAAQDRIYFLKNDRSLGVKNGSLGTIEALQGQHMTVRLDTDALGQTGRTIEVDTAAYPFIDQGYAATIHKAQGVTVDHSYLLATPHLDRHALYVAGSRHRESFDIFYSQDDFAQDKALLDTVSRERAKDMTLDYTLQEAFALQRGIERGWEASDDREHSPNQPTTPLASSLTPDAVAGREETRLSSENRAISTDPFLQLREQLGLSHVGEVNSRYEAHYQVLRQQAGVDQGHDALDEFREAYEAAVLQQRYAQKAVEAEAVIAQFQESIEHSRMPQTAQAQLEAYVARLMKQPEMMAYVKEQHPHLAETLDEIAKPRTLERELDLDKGEIDF